jgi:hypothetical protein
VISSVSSTSSTGMESRAWIRSATTVPSRIKALDELLRRDAQTRLTDGDLVALEAWRVCNLGGFGMGKVPVIDEYEWCSCGCDSFGLLVAPETVVCYAERSGLFTDKERLGPAGKSVQGETHGKLVIERKPLRVEKLDDCSSRCRLHP